MRFLVLILTLAATTAPAETLRIRAGQLIDPEGATVAADQLKLTPAEMTAACDEAKRLGSYCIAPAHGAEGIKAAIYMVRFGMTPIQAIAAATSEAAIALRIAGKFGSLSPGADVVQAGHLVHRDDASEWCDR